MFCLEFRFNKTQLMFNKELLYKSDYFKAFEKSLEITKSYLPMKPNSSSNVWPKKYFIIFKTIYSIISSPFRGRRGLQFYASYLTS